MSEMYEGIMTGLKEVLAHAKGEPVDMVIHHIPAPDVRAIRKRMGMSQLEFSRVFGISIGSLRHWEQGRRNPQGPARTLLKVMDKEPEAVKRALAAAREEFKQHRVERLSNDSGAAAKAPASARGDKGAAQECVAEAYPHT